MLMLVVVVMLSWLNLLDEVVRIVVCVTYVLAEIAFDLLTVVLMDFMPSLSSIVVVVVVVVSAFASEAMFGLWIEAA